MGIQEARNVSSDADQCLGGQAEVLNHLFACVESLALKSAVELRIADIIHNQGNPLSLSQIASHIDSPSPNLDCLKRLMRLLVRKNIFIMTHSSSSDEDEPLFDLTPASRWLLHDIELSLAPTFLTVTHPWLMAPWHEISCSIKEGGTPFEKAYGHMFWDRGAQDPAFNKLFNHGMASFTKTMLNAILDGYKDGFDGIQGTIIDVGGGVGSAISEIVKAHPHIKGINFDLPHVVATAPQYTGVTHVGGDMFSEVPEADVVFMKTVLHDWGDDDCLKILKNCQKAVSKKKGKVIIADIVLNPEGKGLFDGANLASDLLMMALCDGGKERTEADWSKLFKEAGFTRYSIVNIPAMVSIIEAHAQ